MQTLFNCGKYGLTLVLMVFSISVQAGFGFFQPQPQNHKEIDQILEEAEELYNREQYEKALKVYFSIVEQSEKANYSKGLATAYIGISGAYFNLGKLDLSTSYLIKAKKEEYAQNNPDFLYNISFRKALNLHSIGLYDEASRLYKNSLDFVEKINDQEERTNKRDGVLINLADIFQSKKQSDSALYYYKTAFYSGSHDTTNKFISAISISELHTDKMDLDSASIYLDYADFYAKQIDKNYSEALYNEILGKYLNAKGDYQQAIEAFQTSLALNQKIKKSKPYLLKMLSEAYQHNQQEELATQYLKQYVSTKDSLDEVNKRNLKVPVMLAKTEKEKQLDQAESYTKWVITSSALLLFILIGGSVFSFQKLKKRGNKRQEENLKLKHKLNSAFDEVVELAESNSPNFLSRFIEVYPEFYNQLITEYPELTTADVRLCALIKLDYSTKEIAEISFSSLRTIQNRMYKLRKKFNLKSEEKLNRWIQTFHLETLNQSSSNP